MTEKQYRVAAIGHTGRGDYGHGIDVAWLEVERAKVVAVADADKMGLAKAAKRLNLDAASSFVDFRKMLDAVKPDAVSVCPRWLDQHHAIVMAAVERGIHVFMEKPFCRNLVEADEIVAACQSKHVKLAIAHQTHYSPKIDVVKKLIADGAIGDVLELRGRGKEDQRGGGEDLWVLGSHVMDLIRTFGGEPKRCYAAMTQGGRPVTGEDIKPGNEGLGPLAGDAVTATFHLASGATGFFGSRRGAGGGDGRFGVQIYGSRGAVEVLTGYLPSVKLLEDAAWSPGRSGAKWQNVTTAGIDKPEPLKPAGGPLHPGNVVAMNDLLDAIEQQREPKCGPIEARATIEMISAVFESHRVGGPVDMPLANRRHPLEMLAAGDTKRVG
ncbi:MAG: Gfo/Idh/MocA family oxidoreductase [Pirellulales bacterium]